MTPLARHAAADMRHAGTRIRDEIKNLEISIPSVIQGRQLRGRAGKGTSRIGIPITIGQQAPAQLSLLYRRHNS